MIHLLRRASKAPPRTVKLQAGVGLAAAVETWRKVRAPQSGMQGNALARRRDEEGHRDESSGVKIRGVKRGNLHPEQHQIGKRVVVKPTTTGRLGRACG